MNDIQISRAAWCNSLERIQHPLYSGPTRNAEPDLNHEATLNESKIKVILVNGLYSLQNSYTHEKKDKPKELFQMKGEKETWEQSHKEQ